MSLCQLQWNTLFRKSADNRPHIIQLMITWTINADGLVQEKEKQPCHIVLT